MMWISWRSGPKMPLIIWWGNAPFAHVIIDSTGLDQFCGSSTVPYTDYSVAQCMYVHPQDLWHTVSMLMHEQCIKSG